MNNEEKLEGLVKSLFHAKKAEEQAKAARIEIETAIVDLLDVDENQSKTFEAGDLKVTVKKALSYVVDKDNLFGAGLESSWLEGVFDLVPPIAEQFEFNAKSYDALRTSNPGAFKEISKYVSTKAKKPSVTLKV